MKINFTEKNIKAIESKQSPFELTDTKLPGFLLRIQPSGRRVFYYSYRTSEGIRRRLKLGRHGDITLTQAKSQAVAAAGDVAKGKDPHDAKQSKLQQSRKERAQTLRRYLDDYYKPWVLKNRKSGKYTLEVIDRHFKHFLDLPISNIKELDIEKWQIQELDRGLMASTVNRNLTALRGIITKAHSQSFVTENVLSLVQNLKETDSKRIRFLSPSEEKQLITALKVRNDYLLKGRDNANEWRAQRNYPLLPTIGIDEYADHLEPMIILTMNTGLRKGELFALKWSDIDFTNRTLMVKAANAKSSKVRHIPLCQIAYNAIVKWKKQDKSVEGYVFKNSNGNRFTDIKKGWKGILESAKIKDFRFHDLRHHFASTLVMRGAPLNTVRELLGHSSINTTLRYAHLGQDHKSDTIRLLDSVASD